jgi:hypothetical protein
MYNIGDQLQFWPVGEHDTAVTKNDQLPCAAIVIYTTDDDPDVVSLFIVDQTGATHHRENIYVLKEGETGANVQGGASYAAPIPPAAPLGQAARGGPGPDPGRKGGRR